MKKKEKREKFSFLHYFFYLYYSIVFQSKRINQKRKCCNTGKSDDTHQQTVKECYFFLAIQQPQSTLLKDLINCC